MPDLLSSAELTQMRADLTATLDATCVILVSSSSLDALGESVLAWSTAGTAVPCRLRQTSNVANLLLDAGQITTVANWTVTLPFGTVVAPGARIVIDDTTYEVKQSWDEETWELAARVDVSRIEA